MDGEESLSSDKLLQFALDVAKGMRHLATSGVSTEMEENPRITALLCQNIPL